MRLMVCLWCVALLCPAGVSLASPPARPLGLTVAQFQALEEIQTAPEHQAIRQVRATYSSEQEQILEANVIANDITTAMTQAGWPGALLAILIAAAPL